MKKVSIRSVLSTVAFSVALSSFAMGASANGNSKPALEPSLVKIQGDYNLKSAKKVKVIVELNEESVAEAKKKGVAQSKGKIKKARDEVKKELSKASKTSKVKREYDQVFSGFSAELPANDLEKVASLPGVKAIYPSVEYHTTEVKSKEVSAEEYGSEMDKSIYYVGADQAWKSGYTGKNMTVAVIDTGVDYDHPDLKPAFEKYKGWDFVDDDKDPQETPAGDPKGEATTHGTHVAGTIAADGKIKGVAPDAHLLAYRVLGPGGTGTTEDVIAGIERAVEDGADVMNLSLGDTINNPDLATSIALDWAMEEGVVAVTSNGNSGPANWTVGSPGTSREAISVGATQLPYNLYKTTLTVDNASYASAEVMGFPNDKALLDASGKKYEFVPVGLGKPEDFEGKDVKGKVAVISRGDIAFVDKVDNAKKAGAVATVIYNNVEGTIPDIPGTSLPSIRLSKADGQALAASLAKGSVTGSFTATFDQTVDETMADFSSRGPVVDTWMIKPDISAPGVDIISTVPTNDPSNPHGYGSKQGTSMAAPHVAGAAALILQAHPNYKVEDVKASLMNTTELLRDRNGLVYPHNTQGAGSMRVVDAIKAKTLITPGSHSYGVFYKDKGKQVEKQSFKIKNLSNHSQKYSVKVKFKKSHQAIDVKSTNDLVVNAGKTQKVNLNVKVDAGKLSPGYYEGTITVSNNKETYDVPTILFVKEPDYPRVTSAYVDVLGNGSFEYGSYLPGGAEKLSYYIYDATLEKGELLSSYTNVEKGFSSATWDGKINGETLPAGTYYLYAEAVKAGQTTGSLGEFEIK
ncbi:MULTISPECIES: S8 family serine peptidase [Priestia]|uniref:S8 family serine peptidase n=1 Tax=Priestia TaxID=2800373 RepID=UPI0023309502|nr:S8 family serine peptidase [Priestia sp. AB]MDC0702961.1 S8 family serine peptidase [Priestia sp. AB]